jgi:hypothetical protein
MKHLRKFNELNTQTYADLLNKTENYPWIKFLGDKLKKADKMEKVNILAKEHFTKAFMDEFKEGTKIKNGDKEYKFKGIKFNTNYTSYDLHFEGEKESLTIKYDPSGYYLGYGIEDKLDLNSIKIIKSMFKYMKK